MRIIWIATSAFCLAAGSAFGLAALHSAVPVPEITLPSAPVLGVYAPHPVTRPATISPLPPATVTTKSDEPETLVIVPDLAASTTPQTRWLVAPSPRQDSGHGVVAPPQDWQQRVDLTDLSRNFSIGVYR